MADNCMESQKEVQPSIVKYLAIVNVQEGISSRYNSSVTTRRPHCFGPRASAVLEQIPDSLVAPG
jgi:hypothetical protein